MSCTERAFWQCWACPECQSAHRKKKAEKGGGSFRSEDGECTHLREKREARISGHLKGVELFEAPRIVGRVEVLCAVRSHAREDREERGDFSRPNPSFVVSHVRGHVVDLVVHHDPAVVLVIVLGHLFHAEDWPRLAPHHVCMYTWKTEPGFVLREHSRGGKRTGVNGCGRGRWRHGRGESERTYRVARARASTADETEAAANPQIKLESNTPRRQGSSHMAVSCVSSASIAARKPSLDIHRRALSTSLGLRLSFVLCWSAIH
jgi:hypothetical protein